MQERNNIDLLITWASAILGFFFLYALVFVVFLL